MLPKLPILHSLPHTQARARVSNFFFQHLLPPPPRVHRPSLATVTNDALSVRIVRAEPPAHPSRTLAPLLSPSPCLPCHSIKPVSMGARSQPFLSRSGHLREEEGERERERYIGTRPVYKWASGREGGASLCRD